MGTAGATGGATGAAGATGGGTSTWKPNVNNGTDLWEANLRNGGAPPPAPPASKTPWGHTPTTNIGKSEQLSFLFFRSKHEIFVAYA